MRADSSIKTNVLVVLRPAPEDDARELPPAEAAQKARVAHALGLLDQVCAPAAAKPWKDALLANEPEVADLLLGQFVGLNRSLTVTVGDDGKASFHAENPFLDAAPVLKLAEALAPHARAAALKILQTALAGSELQSERMTLADALLRLLAAPDAVTLPEAEREPLASSVRALLADPSIAWQDKRRFAPLLPANSSRAPGTVEAVASVFYKGLFTGDTALASRALEQLRNAPGEQARRLATQCMADHQALALEGVTGATASIVAGNSGDPTETALHRAAEGGDLAAVKALLPALAPGQIDATRKSGATALLIAAADGHLEILRLLLDHGASPKVSLPKGATPLYMAAQNGRTEVVNELLARSPAQLNTAETGGVTPLMIACAKGHLETVKLLLDQPEIDVHATRHADGATALFMAAAHGKLKVVQALVSRPDKFELAGMTRDPKVKGGDRWGALPISIAAENGHEEVVKVLQPLTPAAPPRPGKVTPIATDDSRCWSFTGSGLHGDNTALKSAARGGSRDIALNFLGTRDDAWFRKDDGGIEWDRFVSQVRKANIAGTRWLLHAHGSKWSFSDPRHRLSFVPGEFVGTSEAIRVLVEAGVRKIDVWSCYAKLAINHLALRMECDPGWPQLHEPLEVTVIGEEKESSPTVLDLDDRLLLMRDLSRPNDPPAATRLSVMTRTTVRFDPASSPRVTVHSVPAPDLDTIAARVPRLGPEEQKHLIGSYLTMCCFRGDVEELERTIAMFPDLADLNYQPQHFDRGLLALAASTGHLKIVEFLLRQPGIPVDGHGGKPPLWSAAFNGHDTVVKALLNAGAVVEVPNEEGFTPLYVAAQQGKLSTVELLLRHGANTECLQGTARGIAARNGHTDVVKLLDNWKGPAG